MKFKLLIFSLFFFSCTTNTSLYPKKTYTAKGFAYIYNNYDVSQKIIKGRLDNEILQISHQKLRIGTLIKISNPKNKQSIVLKNSKRIKYPNFYKVLITKRVAEKLNLNPNMPILEITEVKKNKSFIAKKAKIFNEEKKIPSKAPVASVQISNISKNKIRDPKKDKDEIFIHIASFYSSEVAVFLKKRIINEISDLDQKKIKIKKVNDRETQVILGPYTSINLLKNDYIKLNEFGFEEMDILINE